MELPGRKKAEEGEETAEERDAVLVDSGEWDVGRGMGGDEMEYELFEQDIARRRVDADAGGVWGDVDEDLVVCQLWDGEEDLYLEWRRGCGDGDGLVSFPRLLGEEVRVWRLEVELNR